MSRNRCPKCKEFFEVDNNRKYKKIFCSRSCSNSRGPRSKEFKKAVSLKLKKPRNILICENCKGNFICKKTHMETTARFCSTKCAFTSDSYKASGRKYGLISASLQFESRRSKNEILFHKLCQKYFNNVRHNERIFNGWDADIIIDDYKIAILWNGKWHYKKITHKHSLKDIGKFNIKFVNAEFNKFKNILNKVRY